jgi:putative Mg2+ transporter-C (MgtC) family protein
MLSHAEWYAIIKVIISIFLGAIIGLERELASKPAGLRTHMLVAGTSTLFVLLGDFILQYFMADPIVRPILEGDPLRILRALFTGMSILAAGTIIFRHQDRLEGLTTAASILFVSTLAMLVAVDEIAMAVIITFIVIIILFFVGKAEAWIARKRKIFHDHGGNGEGEEES